MFSTARTADRRLITTTVLALCFSLSACGSDGVYGVASSPPPPPTPTPTPTPTPPPTPAAPVSFNTPFGRPGSYDLSGAQSISILAPSVPGNFNLTVSKAAADLHFNFDAPTGFVPAGITSVAYGPSDFVEMNDATRGFYRQILPFSSDENIQAGFSFDAGYSYVSMGEWGWSFVHLDGGAAGGGGVLLFVFGDRTPPTGIPVSGTATYDAHTLNLLSRNLTPGIPFTLTADFGQRLISARIDQDYRFQPNGDSLDDPAQGVHVAGSAAFSNSGAFIIPLSGTVNHSGYNIPATPPSEPVTGTMNGAFFGPRAEQVGGTFSLQNSGGGTLMRDAFVGQQHQP